MRCEVVASLIHFPKIIFLDEPTIWLDIIAKQKLRDVINKINADENTTIFLTSHDIWDIEWICNRVIIINYWKILFDWDIKKLKKDYIKSKILSIKLNKNYKNLDFPDFIKIRKKLDDYIEIEIPNDKKSLEKTLDVLNKNYDFEDLNITEPSMEEIIKMFY
jgi:ABC-2 type transport system ATP-binding protein